MTTLAEQGRIRAWMKANVVDFVDNYTGEVNCTELVEAWDRDQADGAATLDPTHIAWVIAVEVATDFESQG